MKTEELKSKFNNEFGLGEWPKTYEVDHETYAFCCQAVFNWIVEHKYYPIIIELGPNNGLMFKNVELLLKKL